MDTTFIYFAKASVLLLIFYLIYSLLLKKETFFQHNRFFLLSGILLSLTLPILTFQKIVLVSPAPTQQNVPEMILQSNFTEMVAEPENVWQWEYFVLGFYLLVSFAFLAHFVMSLWSVRKQLKGQTTKLENISLVCNPDNELPFSFFHFVVFNAQKFEENEWNHILAHEKVHAQQWHTLDVLFVKIVKIFFWFHPVYWLYEKSVVQNLEFIADEVAINQVSNKIDYQKIMLLFTTKSKTIALTNPFYQSLIKKRIVMLNQEKSRPIQQWKFATVLPFLLIFIFQFQIELIAQEKPNVSTSIVKNSETKYIFSNSTDENLENIVIFFKQHHVDVKISKVKRNANDEIIAINVKITNENQKVVWEKSSDDPIEGFEISMIFNENETKNIAVKSVPTGEIMIIDQANDVVFDSNPETMIATGGNAEIQNNVVKNQDVVFVLNGTIIDEEKAENAVLIANQVTVLKEDEAVRKYGIKNTRVVEIETKKRNGEAVVEVSGVTFDPNRENNFKENLSESTFINHEKALYFLDEKPISYQEILQLDPKSIKITSTQTGSDAFNVYGKKAEFGLVKLYTENSNLYKDLNTDLKNKEAINTKKELEQNVISVGNGVEYKVNNDEEKTVKINLSNNEVDITKSLLFIDNKPTTYEQLQKQLPTSFKMIKTLNSQEATAQFGEKGKFGAIYLYTKQKIADAETSKLLNSNTNEKGFAKENADGFIIHKNTTTEELVYYKKALKERKMELKIASIQRNKSGEIIQIEISLKEKGKVALATWQTLQDGIPEIFVGKRNGKLMVMSDK
uniref:M56 family metallopeptidase n=1 Tax=Flavobacterium sp. TaxID=239 RepID=UPI004048FA10